MLPDVPIMLTGVVEGLGLEIAPLTTKPELYAVSPVEMATEGVGLE